MLVWRRRIKIAGNGRSSFFLSSFLSFCIAVRVIYFCSFSFNLSPLLFLCSPSTAVVVVVVVVVPPASGFDYRHCSAGQGRDTPFRCLCSAVLCFCWGCDGMRLRGEGWDIQSEVNRGHWFFFFFFFYSERNGTDWDPPPPASLPAACSLVRSLLLILNLSFAISSGRERREEREKELTFGVWRHLMDHQLMASSSIHRLPLLLPLPLPPVFQNHRPAYHLLFLSSSILCVSPVPSRPWPLRRRRRRLYLPPPLLLMQQSAQKEIKYKIQRRRRRR